MNKVLTAWSLFITLGIFAAIAAGGCSSSPTKEQLAHDAARRQESKRAQEAALAAKRSQARAQAQARQASGNVLPPRPTDPGHPIVQCVRPSLPENVYTITTLGGMGFNTITFICGNSKVGADIVKWRRSYCEGSEDYRLCVISAWRSGEPTFEDFLEASSPSRTRIPIAGQGLHDVEVMPFQL